MPNSLNYNGETADPDCTCDACRRIRDLDAAAGPAEPDSDDARLYNEESWAWRDFNDDYQAPQVIPAQSPRLSESQLRAGFAQAARNITGAVAATRSNALEIVEAAATCTICGVTSEPYAIEDRLVCEACYLIEIGRLYSCSDCSNSLEPGNVYNFRPEGEGASRRFCRNCIRIHQDYCNNCGQVEASGTMRRDQRDRPVCRNCHRPEWKPSEWHPHRNTYRLIPRGFTFGIELETCQSENYADLEGETTWGCVPEASTSGREFVSPVLRGDLGLFEVKEFIQKWGSEWEVDNYCGTHVHIGLKKFSMEQQRRIAYGYYCMWPFISDVIGPERANNSMCGPPQWSLADLMEAGDIEDFAEARDRFEFVNWRSLLKYGTIEIRCLKGTLDSALIAQWTRWHCLFIKKCASMSMTQLQKKMADPMNFGIEVEPGLVADMRERMNLDGEPVRRTHPLRARRNSPRSDWDDEDSDREERDEFAEELR